MTHLPLAAGPARHPLVGGVALGLVALCALMLGRASGFPAPVIAAVAGMGLGLAGWSAALGPALGWWAKPGLKTGVALLGAQACRSTTDRCSPSGGAVGRMAD